MSNKYGHKKCLCYINYFEATSIAINYHAALYGK